MPRRIKILFNVTSGNGVDLLCLIRSWSGSLNYFRNLHVFLLFSLTTHLKLFFLFLFLFFIIANNILKEIRVIVRVCEKTNKTKQFCLTKKSQKLTVGLRKLYFPLNFRWTSSPKSACHSWKLGWHKWEKETLCYSLCLYVFMLRFFSLLLPQGFFPRRECHKKQKWFKSCAKEEMETQMWTREWILLLWGERKRKSKRPEVAFSKNDSKNAPLSDAGARIHIRGKFYPNGYGFLTD